MSNKDLSVGPIVTQNGELPWHFITFCMGSSSTVKQSEATDTRSELVQKFGGGKVGNQENIAILTSIALPGNTPPFSKSPFLLTSAPEFPQFLKLPTELRLMIWKEALPCPRLVEVYFQFENNEFPFGSKLASCATRTPPPGMLGACHESRVEALKHFSMCFALGEGEANICFDLKVDTMFLSCDDLIELLCSLDCVSGLKLPYFRSLRHLAIGLCGEDINIDPQDLLFLTQDLPGLETLTFVLHEKHGCRSNWHDVSLSELITENEPMEFRDKMDRVMEDRSLWMPGTWRPAPTIKFMEYDKR